MPVFELNQLLGPIGGTLALALFSGMGMGWRFRVAQDKNNREYLENMLALTDKKLKESDEVCQLRVDQVRADIDSLTKRHVLELNSIRASHKDEVETLKGILENVLSRLNELSS